MYYFFVCSTSKCNTIGKISNIDENKEFILTKTHNIPYFIINQGKIEGCEEYKYNLGTLSLYDSEYQKIYFASFNENLLIELNENNENYKLIKKNKIYLMKNKIPEKTREQDELIINKIIVKLSYNNVY